MKDSMSALDLRAIASEFQSLLQSRVKKCYQPHYEQIVLRLNPKGSQSVDMVIVRGSRVYLSQRDRPMPVNPGQFAMLLRKYLANARLVAIEQLEFDRVLHLTFETGHGFYAPWTATANFYVGMGQGFFLAHSLANVHSRFEALVRALLKLLELFVPSIHEVDEVTETNYLHPVASIFWSIAEVPHHILDEGRTHSSEVKHPHPIAEIIASVAGVPPTVHARI